MNKRSVTNIIDRNHSISPSIISGAVAFVVAIVLGILGFALDKSMTPCLIFIGYAGSAFGIAAPIEMFVSKSMSNPK